MAWRRVGVCVAALGLLGCNETRISLLEPIENVPPPVDDAGSTPPPSQPMAGMDAGEPPVATPDAEPPPVDAGSTAPDAGVTAADALVLRYNFSGSGEVLPDLVGDRDARLHGGTMLRSDLTFIDLDGMDDYVDIPDGVVSGLHSATFVVWLSWFGGPCWQRIFDFGISDQGEDAGNAVTSLFMTPRACGSEAFTAMAEVSGEQFPVTADEPLPIGPSMQVALTFDGDSQTFTLYRDLQAVGEATASFQLEQLDDTNNWLGRSQWAQDAFYRGRIGEFRIYSRVLTATEIAQVYAEGFGTP